MRLRQKWKLFLIPGLALRNNCDETRLSVEVQLDRIIVVGHNVSVRPWTQPADGVAKGDGCFGLSSDGQIFQVSGSNLLLPASATGFVDTYNADGCSNS